MATSLILTMYAGTTATLLVLFGLLVAVQWAVRGARPPARRRQSAAVERSGCVSAEASVDLREARQCQRCLSADLVVELLDADPLTPDDQPDVLRCLSCARVQAETAVAA